MQRPSFQPALSSLQGPRAGSRIWPHWEIRQEPLNSISTLNIMKKKQNTFFRISMSCYQSLISLSEMVQTALNVLCHLPSLVCTMKLTSE